ncbi:MAG: protein translocase subunit SecD [Oligoflexia bacterium]|nr:protein translocase subunit SecD [Oligoflexia bacterium]
MGSDLKKRFIILGLVLAAAIAFLLPTIERDTFKSGWISKPISLGLDLSGGVHLVYEVQTRDAISSRLSSMISGIRSELRNSKIAVTRARVNDKNQLEVSLLSSKFKDQARQKFTDSYRELQFVGEQADGDKVILTYGFSPANEERIQKESVDQAIETLRNRVDQFGVSEPLIQRVGERRILLQMPGISDIEAVKKVVGSVAKLEFHLVPSATAENVAAVSLKDKAGAPIKVEEEALMSGDAVSDARVAFENGLPEVALTLTSEGGTVFGKLTAENVGRQLAIVLDGVVYSSPVIRDRITGGHASISGSFTMEEARQLAVVLRAGALPAALNVMEERTVGPTLGAESIRKGITAIVVGSLFVFVFMAIYYKKSGLIAVGSLILNLFLSVACLSAFGATLTLPGLAGLALTIGMAVDSNVIIFERIKDELRNGSTRDAAITAGFEKALSAIIDSNLTTLLSGLILYYFGTGSIRGFAVTLSIGILTTIFCAVFASKLAFEYFSLKGREELSI